MTSAQKIPRFPSYHLELMLRSDRLSTVTAKPLTALPVVIAFAQARKRLQAALAQLNLPRPHQAIPYLTKSCANTVRAVANIEIWLAYLPRDCVRTMVLDGWHWST